MKMLIFIGKRVKQIYELIAVLCGELFNFGVDFQNTLGAFFYVDQCVGFEIVVDGENRNAENLCVREFFFDLRQDLIVVLQNFIGWHAAVDVVDADHNRNDVGLKCDRVAIQAVEQLIGAVAADALIDKLKRDVREVRLDLFHCIFCIAVPHVVVIATVSACIGDAIALEYDFHIVLIRE